MLRRKQTLARVAFTVVVLFSLMPMADAREAGGIAWAYATGPKQPLPEVPPGIYTVPGSAFSLSATEINKNDWPPDWLPTEHPPAPKVVQQVCAGCHLLNGQGFLDIPNLAGLPAAYIVEQVRAFRNGERRSTQKSRPATNEMIKLARKYDDTAINSAAAYFAARSRGPWIRVVETQRVPRTVPNYYGWRELDPNGGSEAIDNRIIEVAEDFGAMLIGDPHSSVVAYVPPGAMQRGQLLVNRVGGAAPACVTCHGADLKGIGTAPPLAGRSPSYLARMLWDIKTGARRGPTVALMQQPAKPLTPQDITEIVAYLASLPP